MKEQLKGQFFLLLALGLIIFCQTGKAYYNSRPPSPPEKLSHKGGSAKAFGLVLSPEKQVQVSSVKELNHLFNNWKFDLTKAKSEGKVPRLYLAKLPQDMRNKHGAPKKSSRATFIQVVLPHILKVNEQILVDRAKLLDMQKRQRAGKSLRQEEKIWLMKLASAYRCKSTRIEALLHHVDVVPPSLALAQGILESGWGTSSAAVKKNSTFGHMRTKTKVESFDSLLHNVVAYIQNLNRHNAYREFRRIRADLRKKNHKLCGITLAPGLKKYSVRGASYTKDLQGLIRRHKLDGYDHMTLEQHMRMKP